MGGYGAAYQVFIACCCKSTLYPYNSHPVINPVCVFPHACLCRAVRRGYTDQLTQESAGGKITTITYDNSNRRQAVSIVEGSNSASMSYTYDVRDRILSKTIGIGGVSTALGYTRVPGGKLDVMTTNHAYSSDYDYNPNNGLLQFRTDNGLRTEYQYFPTNNLEKIILPNGAEMQYHYNSVNKLDNIAVKVGTTVIQDFTYALGPTGNKTGVTESAGRAVTWAFDDLYRLTNEQIASTPVTGNIGYIYDDVGNRDQRSSEIAPIPTQVFIYDQNDRVQAYSWDNNGNVLSDGRFNYTWNAKNELIHVIGDGVNVEYFYDADGLRVYRKDNMPGGVTTYYVWDTENPTGYPQVVEEIEGGQVVRRYGYGLFLETIDIKNGTDFERFYVIRDGTNSVRMLLDSTGNVSATYDYDAFGNLLSTSNTNPLTASNPYQFHSEYKDQATNLVYLRARWYDSSVGRFTRMDSYEGSQESPSTLNKYVSFNNNPANMTDPLGLTTWPTEVRRIVSPFTQRTRPGTNYTEFHPGLDIAVDSSGSVYASDGGVVVKKRSGVYVPYVLKDRNGNVVDSNILDPNATKLQANTVLIRDDAGLYEGYTHISTNLTVGERVYEGEWIGQYDGSGYTTGPHLHYMLRTNSNTDNYDSVINPEPHITGKPLPSHGTILSKYYGGISKSLSCQQVQEQFIFNLVY